MRPTRERPVRPGLVAVGLLVVALVVHTQLLKAATASGDALGEWRWWEEDLPVVGLVGSGLVVLWRLPGHLVGRILVVFGTWFATDAWCSAYAGWTLTSGVPGGPLVWWLTARGGAGLQLAMPLLLLCYPDGHLPRGRWRIPGLAVIAASVIFLVAAIVMPRNAIDGPPRRADVLDRDWLSIPTLAPYGSLLRVVLIGLLGPALLAAVLRLVLLARSGSRQDPLIRTRARWLVWAGLVDVLGVVSAGALHLPDVVGDLIFTGGIALSGVCAAIGLLAPDLLDIGRLLGGTVVYGVVVVGLLVVDAAVVAVVVAVGGERVADRDGAVLAVLLVAALYGPVRERLWDVVRRGVLGERSDRYRVVSDLAGSLESGPDGPDRLRTIARAASRAFRFRYVAVEVHGPDGLTVRADAGTPTAEVRTIPLRYRGIEVGSLLLDGTLTARDEQLLTDVARQAAVVLRTEDLTADLRRRRSAQVRAREDARQRLRQDLHDELAPTLAAVAARLDHAGGLLPGDPAAADGLLGRARADLARAVVDVRRLAAGLRPPALDDLGLNGAVRRCAQTSGLHLDLTLPPPSTLPAAVEVVALLVVSETVADAVAAGARSGEVRLGRSAVGLEVLVRDDGYGAAAVTGFAERVAELGGATWAGSSPAGDRLTRVLLPLGVPAEEVGVRG